MFVRLVRNRADERAPLSATTERNRNGLKTGELEETKIAAHSIKGSAAVFGATELSESAKALEHAVKNGETEGKDLAKMADTIETCFKAVDRETLVSAMM